MQFLEADFETNGVCTTKRVHNGVAVLPALCVGSTLSIHHVVIVVEVVYVTVDCSINLTDLECVACREVELMTYRDLPRIVNCDR